jgi:hypothetical protein
MTVTAALLEDTLNGALDEGLVSLRCDSQRDLGVDRLAAPGTPERNCVGIE